MCCRCESLGGSGGGPLSESLGELASSLLEFLLLSDP